MVDDTAAPALSVESLSKRFGGVRALEDVSFSIGNERIVGIIGPNGSGKSTLFNLITGVDQPTGGRIFLQGSDITGATADSLFRQGMSRTFQNTRLFGRLTVAENMLVAALGRGLDEDASLSQLTRMNLEHLNEVPAGSLSYGDQKLVELAMCLVGGASLALLDEPLAGVHEDVVKRIQNLVQAQSDSTTFLIVEHNVSFMMLMCERIIVMDQGRVLADGSPAEVRSDEAVIRAYLGSDFEGSNALPDSPVGPQRAPLEV